jgi:hypothetical protein
MYKLILLLCITLILEAKNPYPYSALGNVIYDNVSKVRDLQYIGEFAPYEEKINNYVARVKKVKSTGYALEKGDYKDKMAYLTKLRALAKEYDAIRRSVELAYEKALKNDDVVLFNKVINSGLLDTDKYKKEIIDFYFEHMDTMSANGIIDSYLKEDAKLRAKRAAKRKRYLSKKQKELERIKRIRRNDKQQQERLEKELEFELKKKKKEIREYQKRELSKTI